MLSIFSIAFLVSDCMSPVTLRNPDLATYKRPGAKPVGDRLVQYICIFSELKNLFLYV